MSSNMKLKNFPDLQSCPTNKINRCHRLHQCHNPLLPFLRLLPILRPQKEVTNAQFRLHLALFVQKITKIQN